jgi:hypothetical protein
MAPLFGLPPDFFDMLIEEGLTSVSIAVEIRDKAREAWVPIGTMLRQRGHLTMDQFAYLLEIQASEPHVRLGELAVREGFCIEECVEEALRLQREAYLHAMETLLSELQCDPNRLRRLLLRYVLQRGAQRSELPVGT